MRLTTLPPRRFLRVIHLAAALPLFLYLYGPLAGASGLGTLLRVAVVPSVVISGMVMWQRARLLRWRTARQRRLIAPS